jgi:hypothetical protein
MHPRLLLPMSFRHSATCAVACATALTGGMRRERTLLLMHTMLVSESAGTSHHHASTVGNCQPPIRQTRAMLPIMPLAHERRAASRSGTMHLQTALLGDVQPLAAVAVLPGPSDAQCYAWLMSMGVA